MKVYAVTNPGPHKSENEDRIIVGKSILANGRFFGEIDTGFLAIADGVGGNNAGAVASSFVATNLCDVKDATQEVFSHINEELVKLSVQQADYDGMATTLTGIHFGADCVRLFNVGNSRVYLLQSRKYLKQLTTDDTTLNYLLSTGQLSAEDAENFDRKNEITACFGGGKKELLKLKLSCIERPTSPVMITSDGIHDYLSIDQMEDIIAENGISEKACLVMVEEARKAGSVDDISILLGDE